MLFITLIEKLTFHQPLLQSSVSRDPLESESVILICWIVQKKKTFLIIISVENSWAA